MFPVFIAAFAGNAAWDFAGRLIRRGEVVRNVNLRYDKVMTQRLKEISQIEKQDELRQQARDKVVILEFTGTPPRPITWVDVDGTTPLDGLVKTPPHPDPLEPLELLQLPKRK